MVNRKNNGRYMMLHGQAGVYAVAAQLCLRGHIPLFPAVDDGVDLVLDNGLRLQVKAARLTYPLVGCRENDPNFGVRGGKVSGNYLGGAYGFCLRRGSWRPEVQKWETHAKRGYADVADFFVLWGIDENRFWVIPTSIKNRVIWFGRAEHPNGSNNSSYTAALKAKRIADMENRWDLLDVNAVQTLVDSAVTEEVQEKI